MSKLFASKGMPRYILITVMTFILFFFFSSLPAIITWVSPDIQKIEPHFLVSDRFLFWNAMSVASLISAMIFSSSLNGNATISVIAGICGMVFSFCVFVVTWCIPLLFYANKRSVWPNEEKELHFLPTELNLVCCLQASFLCGAILANHMIKIYNSMVLARHNEIIQFILTGLSTPVFHTGPTVPPVPHTSVPSA